MPGGKIILFEIGWEHAELFGLTRVKRNSIAEKIFTMAFALSGVERSFYYIRVQGFFSF